MSPPDSAPAAALLRLFLPGLPAGFGPCDPRCCPAGWCLSPLTPPPGNEGRSPRAIPAHGTEFPSVLR